MSGVMIVENSEKPLRVVKKLLASINYDVVFETDNGFEAVEKYTVVKPDLVISDLSITKSTGSDVLKEIKKNHPESKIVIVSSIQGQKFDQCLDLGASACISIPFSMKEFVTQIIRIGQSDKKNPKIAPVILDE